MSNTARILLTGFFFISCTFQVYAQGGECGLILTQAESEFNAGHFYAIPSLLNECIANDNFSKEQKLRAYLLLSQAYLIIDDPIAAEDSYLKLLKVDPEYVANEVRDPIDIVYLSKKFTATPIFTPHLRFGFNTSIVRSIYSVSTEPYSLPVQYGLRFNLQGGAGLDWNITDNFSLCIEGNVASRAYKLERTDVSDNDGLTLTATQFWLDVPLYVKFSDNRDKKVRPFGYAGVAMNYLLSSSNLYQYTDNKPKGSQLVTEGPSESVRYQRNAMNRSWLVGGGVKYKWGKDFFFVDVRYMAGLSNMVNSDQIYYADPSTVDPGKLGNPNYTLSNNITRYRYVSDLFRLDNVSISFGYIHPIYNPRKVKKAKTKSVSRKIRKGEGGDSK
jgi:Outer membrane protein beta-barrel domain